MSKNEVEENNRMDAKCRKSFKGKRTRLFSADGFGKFGTLDTDED